MRLFLITLFVLNAVRAARPLAGLTRVNAIENLSLFTEDNINLEEAEYKPPASDFNHWCNVFLSTPISSLALPRGVAGALLEYCGNVLDRVFYTMTFDQMKQFHEAGLLTQQEALKVPKQTNYVENAFCLSIVELIETCTLDPNAVGVLKERCKPFFPLPSFDGVKFDDLMDYTLFGKPLTLNEVLASAEVTLYDPQSWCLLTREGLILSAQVQDALSAKCKVFLLALDGRDLNYLSITRISNAMIEASSEKGDWCEKVLQLEEGELTFDSPNVWDTLVAKCGGSEFYKLDGKSNPSSCTLNLEILENSSNLDESNPNHWCFSIAQRHIDVVDFKSSLDPSVIAKIVEKCTKYVFEKLEDYSLDDLELIAQDIPTILVSNSNSVEFDSSHLCYSLRKVGFSSVTFEKIEDKCSRNIFNLDAIRVDDIADVKITSTLLALSGNVFCENNEKRSAIVDGADLIAKKCGPLPVKLDGMSLDDLFILSESLTDEMAANSSDFDGTLGHWCHSYIKIKKLFFQYDFTCEADAKCQTLIDSGTLIPVEGGDDLVVHVDPEVSVIAKPSVDEPAIDSPDEPSVDSTDKPAVDPNVKPAVDSVDLPAVDSVSNPSIDPKVQSSVEKKIKDALNLDEISLDEMKIAGMHVSAEQVKASKPFVKGKLDHWCLYYADKPVLESLTADVQQLIRVACKDALPLDSSFNRDKAAPKGSSSSSRNHSGLFSLFLIVLLISK